MSTKLVIVEPDPHVAQRLAHLTRKLMGGRVDSIECIHEVSQVAPVLQGSGMPTVLLVNLNIPEDEGSEVLRQAIAHSCETVVISPNFTRAMEAFEAGATDFVPRPFTDEQLAQALNNAIAQMGRPRGPCLAVTLAGKLELVPLDSIVAIHGDDDYSCIETFDGRRHLHRKTLSALMNVLPEQFRRVHRSHIVNSTYVERVIPQSGGRHAVVLKNGVRVPASRTHMEKEKIDIG